MSRRGALAIALLSAVLGACATPPPPKMEGSLYDAKGVRQTALTAKEAERMIRARAERFRLCYGRERLNLDAPKLGDFVFRVWIPADGSGADVEVVKETVPNLVVLRGCLEDELGRIKFPAHVGKPITLNVPIQGR